MLTIRQGQYDELANVTLKRFEDEMLQHHREFFPKYVEVYGDDLIRRLVPYGAARAEPYGIQTKRDLPLYLDLMLMLGSHFDEDLQYPWAKEILADPDTPDPIERVDRLFDTADRLLDEAAGKKNEFLGLAMQQAKEIRIDEFSEEPVSNPAAGLNRLLKETWPQKYDTLGEPIMTQLVLHAVQTAQGYGMATERGIVVLSLLIFLLGSDFAHDPQCPWAAQVLEDKQPNKTPRLYKAAFQFLTQW